MKLYEVIIVCVVVIAATVAAIFGELTSPLVGILGIALGYGGKGIVNTVTTNTQVDPLQ